MPGIIDCTPRTETRECFWLLKTPADRLLWYWEAFGYWTVIDRHDRPSKSSQDSWWERSGSSQDSTERWGQNLVACWRSKTRETHFLGSVLEEFFERFFPSYAKKEMKEQFIRLQQWNQFVDEYAAKFLRLGRFTPYMVAEEENRASRFQQGIKMDI